MSLFIILAKHFASLRVLQEAAKAGSLNRASAALNISQPAVTRLIARLEDALGCQLLERAASGVKVTEYGSLILGHYAIAEREMQMAGQNLSVFRRSRENIVSCATASASVHMVASTAAKYRRLHPNQSLHLQEGSTFEMLKLLNAGEVDIVIGTHTDDPISDDIVVEDLFDEELGVFARVGHPASQGENISMTSLLKTQQWVLPNSETHIRPLILDIFRAHDAQIPLDCIETPSVWAVRWFARHSDNLVLSTSVVHGQAIVAGETVRIETDWTFPCMKHALYRRRRHAMSQRALEFVEMLKVNASDFSTAR